MIFCQLLWKCGKYPEALTPWGRCHPRSILLVIIYSSHPRSTCLWAAVSQDWKSSFPNRSVCWFMVKQIGNNITAPDRNNLRVGDSKTSRSSSLTLNFKNYSYLFIKVSLPFSNPCYKVSKTVEYPRANQLCRRIPIVLDFHKCSDLRVIVRL